MLWFVSSKRKYVRHQSVPLLSAGATLPRVLGANVNLSNVDFKGRDFSGHDLSGANLSGANLTGNLTLLFFTYSRMKTLGQNHIILCPIHVHAG